MNKSKSINNKAEDKIVIYTDEKGDTELRADIVNETIWATQLHMAKLFEVNIRTISEHLSNVLSTKELDELAWAFDTTCSLEHH